MEIPQLSIYSLHHHDQKLSIFRAMFILVTLLTSISLAYPLRPIPTDSRTAQISRRSVLSVQEFRQLLKKGGRAHHPLVFWTGGATMNEAKEYANSVGGIYYEDCMDPNDHQNAYDELDDEAEKTQFMRRLSQALAMEAQGTVYVVAPAHATLEGTPKGMDPSVWLEYEYGALQRNTAVTQIIRVDPATKAISVAWKKGDHETVAFKAA